MLNNYILVGVGGTGTHLLDPLIRYLTNHHDENDWHLTLLDGDQIELKNLARQLFNPEAVTANKAIAAARRYNGLPISAVADYLGPQNITQYINEGDTVLIAADNFFIRALIEDRCLQLNSSVVINGGNEESTGSCMIWIRKNGVNVTPRLSFLHPEHRQKDLDRSALSCQQVANLPGGEQLIVANMASAMWMLTALMQYHSRDEIPWTEVQFDLNRGEVIGMNRVGLIGWER